MKIEFKKKRKKEVSDNVMLLVALPAYRAVSKNIQNRNFKISVRQVNPQTHS